MLQAVLFEAALGALVSTGLAVAGILYSGVDPGPPPSRPLAPAGTSGHHSFHVRNNDAFEARVATQPGAAADGVCVGDERHARYDGEEEDEADDDIVMLHCGEPEDEDSQRGSTQPPIELLDAYTRVYTVWTASSLQQLAASQRAAAAAGPASRSGSDSGSGHLTSLPAQVQQHQQHQQQQLQGQGQECEDAGSVAALATGLTAVAVLPLTSSITAAHPHPHPHRGLPPHAHPRRQRRSLESVRRSCPAGAGVSAALLAVAGGRCSSVSSSCSGPLLTPVSLRRASASAAAVPRRRSSAGCPLPLPPRPALGLGLGLSMGGAAASAGAASYSGASSSVSASASGWSHGGLPPRAGTAAQQHAAEPAYGHYSHLVAGAPVGVGAAAEPAPAPAQQRRSVSGSATGVAPSGASECEAGISSSVGPEMGSSAPGGAGPACSTEQREAGDASLRAGASCARGRVVASTGGMVGDSGDGACPSGRMLLTDPTCTSSASVVAADASRRSLSSCGLSGPLSAPQPRRSCLAPPPPPQLQQPAEKAGGAPASSSGGQGGSDWVQQAEAGRGGSAGVSVW